MRPRPDTPRFRGRQHTLPVVVLAVLALVLTACGSGGGENEAEGGGTTETPSPTSGETEASTPDEGDGDTEASGEPYRIGVLVALTGAYSALGEPEQAAAEAYVERLNADGGINGHPIELVVADTTSSESEAVNQMRRLAEEDVIGVIGPSSSGESVAVKQVAGQLEVPVLAMASSRSIVEPVDEATWIFKNFPSTDLSLRAQLAYASDQGQTRVAIIGANNAYGQEPIDQLPDLAAEYGLEVVGSETFDPSATDVTSQLTALQGSDPETILVWAVQPANAIVARNAADLGMTDVVLSHSPGAASFGFIDTAGEAAEGNLIQGTVALVPESMPQDSPQYGILNEFVTTYSEEYGEDPNQFAGNAWDAMAIMTEALGATDVDPGDLQGARSALRESLETNIRDFPGINSIYNYTPDDHAGQGVEGLSILRVENGAFVLEETLGGGS